MSSLLQHDGETRGNRVVLKMYRILVDKDDLGREQDAETFLCGRCGSKHAVIYKVARRPVGMWGCWVEFRYNGAVHVPDLSVPIGVEKLPRDAERMGEEAMVKYWHSP